MSLLLDKLAASVTVCRGCGCDDNHACVDGAGQPCSWALLDIETASGVCSSCAARAAFNPFALAAMGAQNEEEAALAIYAFARVAPAALAREQNLSRLVITDQAA